MSQGGFVDQVRKGNEGEKICEKEGKEEMVATPIRHPIVDACVREIATQDNSCNCDDYDNCAYENSN